MNAHTAKALVQDALYQVLDNKVFRLLVLLVICLVAPTFLIAFKPNEISVLFGTWTLSYADVGWILGHFNPNATDANVRTIQRLQSFFVQGLPGNFGVMLSLAATAFFVPRMLEKGEADTLFSKPVSRFVLLLTRYMSGVLFVGALALLLVFGMHLGFLLRSGYSDAGFLWSAVTMTYVFALIHAFSVLIGVTTRSSVAALLISIVLFAFNGCVQSGWSGKEYLIEYQRERHEASEGEPAPTNEINLNSGGMRALFACADVFHYVLPKTYDADVLTKKLRTVIAGEQFVLADPHGKLVVQGDPEGMTRTSVERDVDLSQTAAVWQAEEDGKEAARLTITRHERSAPRGPGESARPMRMSPTRAANDLVKALDGRAGVEGKPAKRRLLEEGPVHDVVEWKESRDTAIVSHARSFLVIDEWMFEIDFEADPEWLARGDHPSLLRNFVEGVKPQRDSAIDLRPDEWYERQFGWTAPLKYNAFFSLASSIAFAALMLLLARWRLSRIDF